MDKQPRNHSHPAWFRALLALVAVWALILLFFACRYLYFHPIIPWPSPEPITVVIESSPLPSATASPFPQPSDQLSTTAPSAVPPTWTPWATATHRPSPTPGATLAPSPTPTASYTPGPTPAAHWVGDPTLATVTLTPDITPVTVIPTGVPTAEVPDRAINILLLGSDRRPGGVGGLTDVMILVTIHPEGPSAAMLSIPRDLYVWVPEWKMTKINTVDAHGEAVGYPGGGPALLKQTILYNLGIPIHYYAKVDFEGFKRIVETLGGIDVPVTCETKDWRLKSPELDLENEDNWELFTLDQRVQHMDGELALWYVRSRKRSSDFDRTRRQQQVLRAMLTRALTAEMLPRVPQLWQDFSATVATDLGLGEVLQLAALAPRLDLSKIKSRFMAGDAVVVWETPDQNMYTLLPQYDKIAPILADVLEPPARNRAFQDPPVVEVRNGTTRPDLDLLAADNLAWEGLVPVIGQADRKDYTETQVVFMGNSFKGANTWLMTKLFGVYESQIILQPDPSSPVDYLVILGYNYQSCVHKVPGAAGAPTVTPTPVWTPPPG